MGRGCKERRRKKGKDRIHKRIIKRTIQFLFIVANLIFLIATFHFLYVTLVSI
jgi:hypothetical protein